MIIYKVFDDILGDEYEIISRDDEMARIVAHNMIYNIHRDHFNSVGLYVDSSNLSALMRIVPIGVHECLKAKG